MTHKKQHLIILMALLLAALFILPAFAQDSTAQPDTPVPTEEATTETDDPPVIPANNVGTVLLIIGGILALIAGGNGILSVMQRFQENKALVKATEDLGDSVPRPVADKAMNIIELMVRGGQIAIEGLDRIPADSKNPLERFSDAQMIAELERRRQAANTPRPTTGTP